MKRCLAVVSVFVAAFLCFAPALGEPPKVKYPERPQKVITVDKKNQRIEIEGWICFREGILELFACSKGTKEHESIVALWAKPSQLAHALADIGLEAGLPGKWTKTRIFRPPSGPVVKVMVRWKGADGNQVMVDADKWILNSITKEPVTERIKWVYCFAGTADALARADGNGTAIALSNFPAAVLDLPHMSSGLNVDVLYAANPKEVPPLGTPVTVIIIATSKTVKPRKVEIDIVVKKGKPFEVDGKAMTLDALRKALDEEYRLVPSAEVRAEAEVTFGRVMAIMDILRKGFVRIHLMLYEPEAADGGKKLKIEVRKDSKVVVNGKAQSFDEFRRGAVALARTFKTATIVPDRGAPKSLVNRVVRVLAGVGIESQIAPAQK